MSSSALNPANRNDLFTSKNISFDRIEENELGYRLAIITCTKLSGRVIARRISSGSVIQQLEKAERVVKIVEKKNRKALTANDALFQAREALKSAANAFGTVRKSSFLKFGR